MLNLVNQERKKHGLKTLKHDSRLSKLARLKALDIGKYNYRSHISPTYGSPQNMLKNNGVSYRIFGENLAGEHYSPKSVVNAWMRSSGHRANILNSRFTHVGVGYSSKGQVYSNLFIQK